MEYRISTDILSISIIWLQNWNFHTRVTLDFSFVSIFTFSSWVMAIVIFVQIVPLMAEVAETHIFTWKLFQACTTERICWFMDYRVADANWDKF